MDDWNGKTAVVTGGASGIGRALVQELSSRGARVAVCDINPITLASLAKELDDASRPALVEDVDVSDRDAMFRFADRVFDRFGNVHFLANNAGVGGHWGTLYGSSQAAWTWCAAINLAGVVHGVEAFVGRMVASGEAGRVVNTASISGLLPGPSMGAYSPSKYAVVSLTEGLAIELKGTRVTASVLCPGLVNTNFLDSGRRLASAPSPRTDGEIVVRREAVRQQMSSAMSPQTVATIALDAVSRGELYILTHPEYRPRFEKRVAKILAAFDQAEEAHTSLRQDT